MVCILRQSLSTKWILPETNRMTPDRLSVGITGLIGSGKTEAAKYIERTGYPVLFMDQVGHDVLYDLSIIKILISVFGKRILDSSNRINRKKLSEIVFNDQKKLDSLNAILHPKMNELAKEWITMEFEKGVKVVFLEAAILFKMGMNKYLDLTVLIKAAEKDIIKRIMKRDNKPPKEIEKILQTQKMNEEKVDYVIMNNGTLKDLYKSCDDLLEKLIPKF